MDEALANNPRWKAEPNFSKAEFRSLSAASTKERPQEEARSTELNRKLKARSQGNGKKRGVERALG
jgi:hypothetical protein